MNGEKSVTVAGMAMGQLGKLTRVSKPGFTVLKFICLDLPIYPLLYYLYKMYDSSVTTLVFTRGMQ